MTSARGRYRWHSSSSGVATSLNPAIRAARDALSAPRIALLVACTFVTACHQVLELKQPMDAATVVPVGGTRTCSIILGPDGYVLSIDRKHIGTNNDEMILCFDNEPAGKPGEHASFWPQTFTMAISSPATYPQTIPHLTVGDRVRLQSNSEAAVKVDIWDDGFTNTSNAETTSALTTLGADVSLLRKLSTTCPGDPAESLKRYSAGLVSSVAYNRLLFSGVLPTGSGGDPLQRIWVDATSGAFHTNLDLDDGVRLQAWGFNIASDGSQHLAVTQGSKVVQDATVGSLVLYALSAAGSPFSVMPSVAPTGAPLAPSNVPPPPAAIAATGASPTAPERAAETAASSAAIAAHPADPRGAALAALDAAATAITPVCGLATPMITAALQEQLKSTPHSKFTALMTYATVHGGYDYAAEIRDTGTQRKAATTAADAGPGDANGASPAVGMARFMTHTGHRLLSVSVEEAYNWGGALSPSGYAYFPVAQTGTDQLYQLQPVSNVSNNLTLSAGITLYPVVMFAGSRNWCWTSLGGGLEGFPGDFLWGIGRQLCLTRLAVSFGPTFMRGSSGEFFQQLNARIGYELFPYVLLMIGPSWRSENVPIAPIGTLVSLPRPSAPPSFATQSETDVFWSVGISVDLAVVADGLAAVSSAISPSKGGSK